MTENKSSRKIDGEVTKYYGRIHGECTESTNKALNVVIAAKHTCN